MVDRFLDFLLLRVFLCLRVFLRDLRVFRPPVGSGWNFRLGLDDFTGVAAAFADFAAAFADITAAFAAASSAAICV